MTEQVTQEQRWTHEGRPRVNRRYPAPEGPWTDEPDKVHWIDPETDMDCLAVRGPMGAWCGYVAVTEDHPWFSVGYGQCSEEPCAGGWCDHSPEMKVSVHGGLTYADFCAESKEGPGFGICHVPRAGRPDRVWWFGFDCSHAGDASPCDYAMAEHEDHRYPWSVPEGDVYRTLGYVQAECSDLARQLAAVAS